MQTSGAAALPVGEVVSRAYQFLAREWNPILRLTWAVSLVLAAVGYLSAGAQLDALAAGETGLLAGTNPVRLMLVQIVNVVGAAVVMAALLRLALFGERRPGTMIWFAFGADEIRLTAIGFVLGAVFTVVALALQTAILAEGNAAAALTALAVLAAAIYGGLRVALIFPDIVGTGRIRTREALGLTQGNAGRLFAIMILIGAPVLLFSAMLSASFLPRAAIDPAVAPALQAEALRSALLPQAIIGALTQIVLNALFVGAIAAAYRLRLGLDPDAPLPARIEDQANG